MNGHRLPQARDDKGFTLVELLIVIVILGVLATVTVFAVRGITDSGEDSAAAADEQTIEHAQEAHMALHGDYATETELVSAGLLRDPSPLHDVVVGPGGDSYSVTAAPSGGGGGGGGTTTVPAPTTTVAPVPSPPVGPASAVTNITYAGIPAQQYGSGSHTVVVIGYDFNSAFSWGHYANNDLPWYDTRLVRLYGIFTTEQLDAVLAASPDYIASGEFYFAQLDTRLGPTPADYWRIGSQGLWGARDYYFEFVY